MRNFPDSHLMRLSESLGKLENPEALTRAMEGNRCMSLNYSSEEILGMLNHRPTRRFRKLINPLFNISGLYMINQMKAYEIARKQMELSHIPYRIDEEQNLFLQVYRMPGHIFMPMLTLHTQFIHNESRFVSDIRNAFTAVCIERYLLRYGKLPEKLEDLVPEFMPAVPADPFDGKSLRYAKGKIELRGVYELEGEKVFIDKDRKLFKDGYMVYSIGYDLKDNGGMLGDHLYSKDRTFTVVK
jgi:hypothetical protein